jgi:hypothetical protein
MMYSSRLLNVCLMQDVSSFSMTLERRFTAFAPLFGEKIRLFQDPELGPTSRVDHSFPASNLLTGT